MLKYTLKRVMMLIPVIFGVTFLVFFMLDLAPGDISDVIGADYTPEMMAQLREELNLDKPVIYRYFLYMKDLLRGDMGYSYVLQADIWTIYIQRLPYTIFLALSAMVVGVLLSIPLGIYAALKHGTPIDNLCTVGAMFGMSIPNFWMGLLMIILFAQILGWLPAYGANDGIRSVIMPAITLGIDLMASLSRTTRSSMLDVLRSDYLRTARAKGVRNRKVVWNHGLRNALIPIITIFGSQLGSLMGGSVVTESVFSWPGIGTVLVDAIKQRDTTLACGLLIMSVVMICIMQLLVDLAYAFVDPRLKGQYASSSNKKSKKGGAS